jgi:hypothetical protein
MVHQIEAVWCIRMVQWKGDVLDMEVGWCMENVEDGVWCIRGVMHHRDMAHR